MQAMTASAGPAPARTPTLTIVRPTRGPAYTPVTPVRVGLFAALDQIGECVALYMVDGTLWQQTTAFRERSAGGHDQAMPQLLIDQAVMMVSASIGRSHAPVCLQGATATVRASLCGDANTPVVLVHVAFATAEGMTDDELVARYGLTPKELSVLRLMSTGMANKAIAHSLGISAHTARHHTERVFRKLDAHSRSEVTARIRLRP